MREHFTIGGISVLVAMASEWGYGSATTTTGTTCDRWV